MFKLGQQVSYRNKIVKIVGIGKENSSEENNVIIGSKSSFDPNQWKINTYDYPIDYIANIKYYPYQLAFNKKSEYLSEII